MLTGRLQTTQTCHPSLAGEGEGKRDLLPGTKPLTHPFDLLGPWKLADDLHKGRALGKQPNNLQLLLPKHKLGATPGELDV